jgi:hypothetical protein
MSSLQKIPYRLREGKSREAAKGWACTSMHCVRHAHPLAPSRKRERGR